jgi:DNA cross-link repair 1B protein
MVYIPNTTIAVDNFEYKKGYHVYFLSHFHTDHTSGLNSKWNNGTIYCSQITKDLIINKFKLDDKQIVVIQNEETILVPCLPPIVKELQNSSSDLFKGKDIDLYYRCTALDAYHCAGSQMFVFEGYFGKVMYTGDFRFDFNLNSLFDNKKNLISNIDHLYLDITHYQESYPTRGNAMEQINKVIDDVIISKKRLIVNSDCLGKESVYMEIAKKMKTQIYVDKYRYSVIKILSKYDSSIDLRYFNCENIRKCGVLLVIKNKMSYNISKNANVFRLMLSVMFYNKNSDMSIQYSDHSTADEIINFVKLVNPKIISTLNGSRTADLYNEYKQYLNSDVKKDYDVPPAIDTYVRISMKPSERRLKKAKKKSNLAMIKKQNKIRRGSKIL